MTNTHILSEIDGRVALIRLNRPQALNALNRAMLTELAEALSAFDADPAIGAIVLTGSPRAFAAGADIQEMAEMSAIEMSSNGFSDLFACLAQIAKPLIAAVSGFALGGGFELVLLCDLVVAAENAKFGLPEVTIGVIPGGGGSQRLTRAVGKALAMEMILNNRQLSAPEAEQFGLVNRVVPNERILDEALSLAAEIADRSPLSLKLAKEAVNAAFEGSLSETLADERRLFQLTFASQDQKEGMRAFLEKRKPRWTGK
ncbi:MAG: enoyl-CoA hydratase-related protein [Anaerolineales bacterium]|jgi:enoyl-CoA hydratase|nr:enoyl-CoA hydratase-related protein [Anaerolineales bacterium]